MEQQNLKVEIKANANKRRRQEILRREIRDIRPRYWQLPYSSLYSTGSPAEMRVTLSCDVPPFCLKEGVYKPTHNWVLKLERNSIMRPDRASCAYRAILLQGCARLNLLKKPDFTHLTEKLTIGETHFIEKNDVYVFQNTSTSDCYIWVIGQMILRNSQADAESVYV